MRRVEAAGALLVAASLACILVACKSGDDSFRREVPIGARLQPLGGSVVRGAITFRPYEGGVVMSVTFGGVSSGPYRVAIHATPNCTSTNGFSAGPPLLRAGSSEPIVAVVYTEGGSQGVVSTVMRLPGVALDGPAGVNGKSVVVHDRGTGPLDASPGVPNDRIACGVIGPLPPPFQ